MTPYLSHMIGVNASVRSPDEEKALYNWMMLSSKPRTGAGWVFEGRVHWYQYSVCETSFAEIWATKPIERRMSRTATRRFPIWNRLAFFNKNPDQETLTGSS